MNEPKAPGPGPGPGGSAPRLKAAPELAIAGAALAAGAGGAYALAGTPGAVVTVVAFAALTLAVASRLVPAPAPATERPEIPDERRRATTWFRNYWRLQANVREGSQYRTSYESRLGPQLQHLLAARLSERHGVNLYSDPDAARRLLCARQRDNDLWAWVDPGRAPYPGGEAPGIPSGTLARLVRRLEQL